MPFPGVSVSIRQYLHTLGVAGLLIAACMHAAVLAGGPYLRERTCLSVRQERQGLGAAVALCACPAKAPAHRRCAGSATGHGLAAQLPTGLPVRPAFTCAAFIACG